MYTYYAHVKLAIPTCFSLQYEWMMMAMETEKQKVKVCHLIYLFCFYVVISCYFE